MTTKQTLIPSISPTRNPIFRGRKPPRVRVSKRSEAPQHAYREFERDFVPLSPPPPSPSKERDIKGESKRGEAPLNKIFPLSLTRRGGYRSKTLRGVRSPC